MPHTRTSNLIILEVVDRRAWRAWLRENAATSPGVWLVDVKKGSREKRLGSRGQCLAYADAVEEALCFGWIDSTTRKLDALRYCRKFTARNPRSRWSEINIERARSMIAAGKMTARGLAVFKPEQKTEPHPSSLPTELEKRFRADSKAWKNFEACPPYYRRMCVAWVATAKKCETQQSRLQKLMEMSARDQRIKWM
jgi:uncharacterized protein YdeI (YjbR/CyaY-like superfamily)